MKDANDDSQDTAFRIKSIEYRCDMRIKMRAMDKLTLGLKELALLNTSLDGLVELAVKGVGGGRSNLVVRLNIFLDRLAATVEEKQDESAEIATWTGW